MRLTAEETIRELEEGLQPPPRRMAKTDYLDQLEARRRSATAGERRAIGVVVGYLRASSPRRVQHLVGQMLDYEGKRADAFWKESGKALAKIAKELGRVQP